MNLYILAIDMKKHIFLLLVIVLLCGIAYFMGQRAYTLAAQEPTPIPTATPTPYVAMCVITTNPTEPTPIITPTPYKATASPTPTPEPAQKTEYDTGEYRCLARFCKSCVPRNATMITTIVACEVPINRAVQEQFPNSVRYVLLQGNEFSGYSTDATPRQRDKLAADYAMRSYMAALNGDFTHRYTPFSGIYLCYSDDGRYCKVYDKDWNCVCDTSQFDN